MKSTVRKSGNGAIVRIPSRVLAAAKLKIGDTVDIRAEHQRIVIESARGSSYEIDILVAGITDENLHGEIDFGRPVGNENW